MLKVYQQRNPLDLLNIMKVVKTSVIGKGITKMNDADKEVRK